MKRTLALVIALMATALLSRSAMAAPSTAFETAPPENNYPLDVTFRVDVTSNQEITDITLHFSLKNRGQSGFGKPDTFTPGLEVNTEVVVDTNPNTNWLPVGNEFSYFWEATLADGSTAESEPEAFLYLPPGRDWKEASSNLLTVYYFGERGNTANNFLEAAGEVYENVGRQLLETTLAHLPVKVILFVRPDEIAESQPSKGTTVEAAGIVTCGYRPGSADDIIVVAASCGGGSSVDTFRHEFGHIINAAAGESPLVNLPAWLDEGLAVYAQEENGFRGGFDAGLRRGEILPFDHLNLAPSDPDDTLLFYGQANAMVLFLIDDYGKDKLAELMSLTSNGTRFDIAFEQVYGMDMLGFEEAFRQQNGLPPASRGGTPTALPTIAGNQHSNPLPTVPAAPAAQSDSGAEWDPILLGTIGAAVIFALIAVFLLLLSQMLQNRRTATALPGGAPREHQDDSAERSRWGQPD